MSALNLLLKGKLWLDIRKGFFTVGVVRHWNTIQIQRGYRLPTLGVLKARLGQTLSILVWWELSLHMPGRQGQDDLESPCCAKGHSSLDHAAQSSIQSGYKHLHGWGITAPLGKLCQCLTTLTTKNFLLTPNPYLLSFNLFRLTSHSMLS